MGDRDARSHNAPQPKHTREKCASIAAQAGNKKSTVGAKSAKPRRNKHGRHIAGAITVPKNNAKVVELAFPNGNHYQGEWHEGKPSGFGTYVWKDGSRYAGQFRAGELHGTGTKTWASGKQYAGEWSHSTYHGHGELTFPDGSRYVGSFARGMFSGTGRREWTNGDTYDGQWKHNKHHGTGRLETAKGACIYKGEWVAGLMHGRGVAVWEETTTEQDPVSARPAIQEGI